MAGRRRRLPAASGRARCLLPDTAPARSHRRAPLDTCACRDSFGARAGWSAFREHFGSVHTRSSEQGGNRDEGPAILLRRRRVHGDERAHPGAACRQRSQRLQGDAEVTTKTRIGRCRGDAFHRYRQRSCKPRAQRVEAGVGVHAEGWVSEECRMQHFSIRITHRFACVAASSPLVSVCSRSQSRAAAGRNRRAGNKSIRRRA